MDLDVDFVEGDKPPTKDGIRHDDCRDRRSGQLGSGIVRALERLDPGASIVGPARTPANAQGFGIEIRPVAEYREDRIGELGEFIGSVIAGIYEGIRNGAHDTPSDFAVAAGRPHQPWDGFFARLSR